MQWWGTSGAVVKLLGLAIAGLVVLMASGSRVCLLGSCSACKVPAHGVVPQVQGSRREGERGWFTRFLQVDSSSPALTAAVEWLGETKVASLRALTRPLTRVRRICLVGLQGGHAASLWLSLYPHAHLECFEASLTEGAGAETTLLSWFPGRVRVWRGPVPNSVERLFSLRPEHQVPRRRRGRCPLTVCAVRHYTH